MTAFLLALIGAALVNNLLLLLPAGADALRRPAAQLAPAAPLCALLIAVATPLGWLLFHGVLLPLQLEALRLFVYLPLLAALAYAVPRLHLPRRSQLAGEPNTSVHQDNVERPSRASSLLQVGGVGAALGSLLLAEPHDFVTALAMGIGGGLGFWLSLQVLADLLQRLDQPAIPAAFRGAPVLLISAGLMGFALLGLQGLAR